MINSRRLNPPIPAACCAGLVVFAHAILPRAAVSAEMPVRHELLKVLPTGGSQHESFGESLAIDGDTAVVGATGSTVPFEVSGAAYVLTRDADGNWSHQAKLVAPDSDPSTLFGWAVAIRGESIWVSAPADDQVSEGSGIIYTYQRDTLGVWSLEDELIPSCAGFHSRAGLGLAIRGTVAAAHCAGSVVVFRQDEQGAWNEEAILTPADGQALGAAVGIEGDLVVAGAPLDAVNGVESGSAYVFRRSASGRWLQEAKIVPSDGAAHNSFGLKLAVAGGRFAVGADDFNYPFDGLSGGKAYLYTREAMDHWQEYKLPSPSDNQVGDRFGRSIAMFEDTVIVGQLRDGTPGAAYVYTPDENGTWSVRVKLVSTEPDANAVGLSLAAYDGGVLAGAPGDHEVALYAGAAFVFSTKVLPGDFNNDGIMDLADHQLFNACLTGPGGGTLAPECEATDADHDNDADLADFAILAVSFNQ